MLGERAAGIGAEAGDQVQHPGGQADTIGGGSQFQGGQRRQFRRLQHHSGPGCQSRRNLPRGHQQRVVPGNDLPGHANRLVADAAAETRVRQVQRLILLLIQFAGQPGVVAKTGDGVTNVPLRFGQGFAVVAHFQFRQRLLATFQFIGQRLQPLPALGAAGLAPAIVEGTPGRTHGMVDILFSACRHAVEDLLGGRINHVQIAAQVRADPFAVDVELITHGATPGRRCGGFADGGK
ncbi:hypothetical protein D3C85_1224750 [compost metagenome]